jgi:hypothetical protein
MVTAAGYRAFKAEQKKLGISPKTEQGVGPTQLTDPALQAEADFLGGAWKPLPNMVIGFQDFLMLLGRYKTPYEAAFVYDAGSSNPRSPEVRARATKYADAFVKFEKEWAAKLGIPTYQRR